MRRRNFIALLGGAAAGWPLAARGQRSKKVARIGLLITATAAGYATRVEALRTGLRELGYVEGRTIVIEQRSAEGDYDRIPALVQELVHLKVDVLVTHGIPGALAAKEATASIPIVMAVVGDPVTTGLVAGLARPGGNITGSSFFILELVTKRLEILTAMAPRLRRPAVLINSDNAFSATVVQAMATAASALAVEVREFPVRRPEDLDDNFSALARDGVDGLVVMDDGVFLANHKAIAEFALRRRLPSSGFTELASAGGLIGYGVDYIPMFHRAAYFVDKILKGAEPGNLPIEQATKFELVINLTTAKALGLDVPPVLLARADEVIE